MFLKKIVNKKKFSNNRIINNIETKKPYVVFFIDMQNDFMDVEYKRSGAVSCVEIDEENGTKCRNLDSELTFKSTLTPVSESEPHSVLGNLSKIGNFNVADAKEELITKIVSKLRKSLDDNNCKKIYITRDYHPDGHMSFDPNLTPKQYCACKGGVFPAHCIQGHSGSLVINSISLVLKASNKKDKVKVLFKGMSPNCDSFTAVEKSVIDNYSSNTLSSTRACSSISGCYEIYNGSNPLTVEQALDFNLPISFNSLKPLNSKIKKLDNNNKLINDTTKELVKYEFEFSSNKEEIQVCGLAGDYCVRDTITALAAKFPHNDVVVLGGLT